jgi:uncharacterized integral membrane protein
MILFLIGFIINLYLTILKLFTGTIQNHYPLLMLGILLLIIGIQLVSLGLLAELIIQNKKKNKEIYNIKREL